MSVTDLRICPDCEARFWDVDEFMLHREYCEVEDWDQVLVAKPQEEVP